MPLHSRNQGATTHPAPSPSPLHICSLPCLTISVIVSETMSISWATHLLGFGTNQTSFSQHESNTIGPYGHWQPTMLLYHFTPLIIYGLTLITPNHMPSQFFFPLFRSKPSKFAWLILSSKVPTLDLYLWTWHPQAIRIKTTCKQRFTSNKKIHVAFFSQCIYYTYILI